MVGHRENKYGHMPRRIHEQRNQIVGCVVIFNDPWFCLAGNWTYGQATPFSDLLDETRGMRFYGRLVFRCVEQESDAETRCLI